MDPGPPPPTVPAKQRSKKKAVVMLKEEAKPISLPPKVKIKVKIPARNQPAVPQQHPVATASVPVPEIPPAPFPLGGASWGALCGIPLEEKDTAHILSSGLMRSAKGRRKNVAELLQSGGISDSDQEQGESASRRSRRSLALSSSTSPSSPSSSSSSALYSSTAEEGAPPAKRQALDRTAKRKSRPKQSTSPAAGQQQQPPAATRAALLERELSRLPPTPQPPTASRLVPRPQSSTVVRLSWTKDGLTVTYPDPGPALMPPIGPPAQRPKCVIEDCPKTSCCKDSATSLPLCGSLDCWRRLKSISSRQFAQPSLPS